MNIKLDVVVQAYNTNTWEAETEDCPEFEASPNYIARLYF